ncbi:unnamed protein product [Cuscuta europaea]|uniref:Uncharacterized protein n=1 Tax=Cuscuta europaea TaxID=41803 RepID=A0A9P1E4L8_CUSEU|nr:unnamed protein product [Cuscuta europaea]
MQGGNPILNLAAFKGLGGAGQKNKPSNSANKVLSSSGGAFKGLGAAGQKNKSSSLTKDLSSSSGRPTPSQVPPSQYSGGRGPRPTPTPTINQQPNVPNFINRQNDIQTFSNQQHSSNMNDEEIEGNEQARNEDAEPELIEWKPGAYSDLKWGVEPLDPFRSISLSKFERPCVGINAAGDVINIHVGKGCLRFQGIVSKQIKYNLHPAGQRWKWVPKTTKKQYWEQFQVYYFN